MRLMHQFPINVCTCFVYSYIRNFLIYYLFIHLILKTFCLRRHAAKNDHNPTQLFEISPKGPCFAPNQNTLCALSFLTAAYGCLVDLTVNSTSPVLLHLLMRVRVWLAESSSSARRGQNFLGRVEKKQSMVFHMKQSMDAGLSVFLYEPFHLMLFCPYVTVLSCLH